MGHTQLSWSKHPHHTKPDLNALRRSGALVADLLDEFVEMIVPGISSEDLNIHALAYCKKHGAIPAPLLYRGFPAAVCTSINHVVCHGIPSKRALREGDIINVDVTLIYNGWHADASRTYGVGKISAAANRLIDVTYKSLLLGIEQATPTSTTGDIGHAIQSYAEGEGMSVVREFCGHGIGKKFHCPPNVLHFGTAGEGTPLREGMLITIEPMINLGRAQVRILNDGWTAVTRDRRLTAQFEHTILITKDGPDVITQSQRGLDRPPTK